MEVALGQLKVSIPQYEANLRQIVTRLKATGARLVFAPTTPVPTQCVWRYAGEEKPFNEAAVRVMKQMGVDVNDVAAFAREHAEQLQIPLTVHYTPAGYTKLAEKVAESVRAPLDAPRAIQATRSP